MRNCSGSYLRHLAGLAAAALFLARANSSQAQMVDVLNHNGMSDIWELSYTNSLGGLPANSDPDGDGVPNVLEGLAGTDPFDPNSAPRISVSSKAGTNFYVTVPCALGKQYQLQSTQPDGTGAWSNWVAEASVIARTGTVVTLTAPAQVAARFFRIAVSDVDTDGDGVNDWEEYQLGLDPLNPTSNGQLDGNGIPLGDYAYATGRLSSQGVITIAATDPVANQPDPGVAAVNLGMLTVTRGGFPLNALYVNVAPAAPGPGVAVELVDHAAFPRLVYFPVGISSQTIPVLPLANTNRLSPVVATLKVLPGPGYTVGSAGQAGIVISPPATPAGTGLTGAYYTNSSTTYSNSANFN